MKIGMTICEYNPLHNGHLYCLSQMKKQLDPDLVVLIMSGNFTQRGEIAVMNKYLRAKHVINAGADIILELPTVFATAPAEIFAKGAVKLLGSLKGEKTLCFGVENADKSALISAATALSNESEEFKSEVKKYLDEGLSLAKAKQLALEKTCENLPSDFITKPNNILAVEYVKAINEFALDIDVLPIERKGAGYKDKQSQTEFYSAMGIRDLIEKGEKEKCKNFLPSFVFEDLPDNLPSCDDYVMLSLINAQTKELAKIIDCTEGLENRIKRALKNCFSRENLITEVSTKRYTSTRISRITLSTLLKIDKKLVFSSLNSNLYLKVLAIKQEALESLCKIKGKLPFVMRKSDQNALKSKSAKNCFECDVRANDIYNQITKTKTNEYHTQIIKK